MNDELIFDENGNEGRIAERKRFVKRAKYQKIHGTISGNGVGF